MRPDDTVRPLLFVLHIHNFFHIFVYTKFLKWKTANIKSSLLTMNPIF
jgi:hypothetical protein